MQKIISILGVVASVLFATAPQFSTIQPKTAAWLTLIGTVATAASGALVRFGAQNIYITIIGVVIAVFGVLAGAGDLIPENITFVFTVIGTAVAALGKSLFNIEKTDDDDTINPDRYLGFILLAGLIGMAGMTTGCDKSKEYAKTLDRVSGYVGTGLELVEFQVRAGQLEKDPAVAIVTALNAVNEINGQLIAESRKHVSPDGKTLVLDSESKGKLLAIVASSQNVAVGLINNPTFQSIPQDKRDKYTILIKEITATVDILGQLINAVKVQGGK